jgi:hypothetical protein
VKLAGNLYHHKIRVKSFPMWRLTQGENARQQNMSLQHVAFYAPYKRPKPSEKCPYQRISAGLQPWPFYPRETDFSGSAKFLILLYCRNFGSCSHLIGLALARPTRVFVAGSVASTSIFVF